MNRLSVERQEQIIAALVEGCSIRSVERMTGVHRDTIMRLMVRVGSACAGLMRDEMRGLALSDIQIDEVWCYVKKKQRKMGPGDDPGSAGDFWIYTAVDRDTKLVPVFKVGKHDRATTRIFIHELAARTEGRLQLSADALPQYVSAIRAEFGGRVDFAQIVKHYEADSLSTGRYSPPKVKSVSKRLVMGRPDLDRVCTSHVERVHLTTRMRMRRLTRLTNAFSKKYANLKAATSLHFAVYNYVNRHGSIRMTPAQAAGVASKKWSMADIVALAQW